MSLEQLRLQRDRSLLKLYYSRTTDVIPVVSCRKKMSFFSRPKTRTYEVKGRELLKQDLRITRSFPRDSSQTSCKVLHYMGALCATLLGILSRFGTQGPRISSSLHTGGEYDNRLDRIPAGCRHGSGPLLEAVLSSALRPSRLASRRHFFSSSLLKDPFFFSDSGE